MSEKADFLQIIQSWNPGGKLHLNPVITIGLNAFREPSNAFVKSDDVLTVVALQKLLKAMDAERDLLRRQLDKAMDYINDLADNGFEKARAVRDEICEGMK